MFTITNALGKEVMSRPEDFASLSELTFVRMLVVAFSSYVCLTKIGVRVTEVPKEVRGILFGRCCMGTLDFLTTAVALKTLPLCICMIIRSTNPFMTAVL